MFAYVPSIDPTTATLYTILFFIAVAMPGRRSLAGLALILGGLLAWLLAYVYAEMLDAPGGQGLSLLISFAFYASAAAGLLCGLLTRAVLLCLRRAQKPLQAVVATCLIGFAALPSFVTGWLWWGNWERRLPSQACLQSRIEIQVAGVRYRLPAAPLFTIRRNAEVPVSFSTHQGLRQACAMSQAARKPLQVVSLSLRPIEILRRRSKLREAFCRTPASEWGRALCGQGSPLTALTALVKAHLYAPEDYDHQRKLVSHHGTYAWLVQERDKARDRNLPFGSERIGSFDRYDNDMWVVHDGSWKNRAGEPFTLNCSETSPKGLLYCMTTYQLPSGPQVTYHFRAPVNGLEATARAIDRSLLALLDAISIGGQDQNTENGGSSLK